jgi:hypothetical protein
MILDDEGNRINSLSMAAEPGDAVAFELRHIECFTGYQLSAASPDAGVVIWGKANPGDSFQNLQTTPIDLTPYAGTTRGFYFECRVNAMEPAETIIYQIVVSL